MTGINTLLSDGHLADLLVLVIAFLFSLTRTVQSYQEGAALSATMWFVELLRGATFAAASFLLLGLILSFQKSFDFGNFLENNRLLMIVVSIIAITSALEQITPQRATPAKKDKA
jgi:hypothetical protein